MMGYEVFIQKFERGNSAEIPFEKVVNVLSKYGKVEKGNFGFEFISSMGEICDYASLHDDKESGVSGIIFSHPTTHDKLPYVIYDLLQFENTCFFGPDLEFVHSRNEMSDHFPEPLIEGLPYGPAVISSPTDKWPLK